MNVKPAAAQPRIAASCAPSCIDSRGLASSLASLTGAVRLSCSTSFAGLSPPSNITSGIMPPAAICAMRLTNISALPPSSSDLAGCTRRRKARGPARRVVQPQATAHQLARVRNTVEPHRKYCATPTSTGRLTRRLAREVRPWVLRATDADVMAAAGSNAFDARSPLPPARRRWSSPSRP
eukprot:CAMPEP_0180022926 /NCGR_PEP_ID=MMETSP0984-20121128/23142_1 /TAXON_ID=483367 /ORGANISM="non described non described, Strain CCMP 2436" /LENGTH=179 /DNA_ID=CAMNT_0021947043 /DNA_START=185 /DNA_END=722 /DNA_ORIENTATION=+